MSNLYLIKVDLGMGVKEYQSHRVKNNFYFDYQSPIGCSVININNKRLKSNEKLFICR